MFFLNYYFGIRDANIIFFDEKPENVEIKNFTENILKKNAGNFYNYLFLDEKEITQIIHKEFAIVSVINISKSFSLDLNVVIKKNEEFFYTCMSDESNFLARCMLGNTDGQYYQGIDYPGDLENASTTNSKLKFDINQKVLYDNETSLKINNPDSLSGTRVYTKLDFKVLREIILWLQKNSFSVKKVYANELNIVDIYTEFYKIKISLDKGYVETLKDFEIISRTGKLQEYINDKKEEIDYIDLSYKNKVFYKLKSETVVATSTSSTTFINSTPIH